MFWSMLRGKIEDERMEDERMEDERMEDERMEDDKIEDQTMSLPAISSVLRLDAYLPIVPT